MSAPREKGLLGQLATLLTQRQRRNAILLLLLMVAQAAAELVGVASIAPFMGVVADSDLIHRNTILSWLYQTGGFSSETQFLMALGIAVMLTLALTNGLIAVTTWAINRFVWGTHHQISVRMLRGYLAQPYSFFTRRNTASLSQNILSEIQVVVERVLMPVLMAVSRTMVTVAIVGLLIFVEPLLALIVVLVLGGAYGAVFLFIKRKQRRLGRVRAKSNELRYKLAGEAFGGIKDVKVLQRETDFAQRFVKPSADFSYATASNRTMSVIPRYLLETIAFGSVLVIVLFYLQAGRGIATILPALSLYAFAGLRLMPALQSIFSAATEIRFNRAMLEGLVADLKEFGSTPLEPSTPEPLPDLANAIEINNLVFRYPGLRRPVLDAINITIPKNQSIGLVGASGSGKTTLVDLLLGLYTPEDGDICVDGTVLNRNNLGSWRKQIGYVPQHIFLTDDTIANNIAFGVPPDQVKQEQVEKAAKIAHLHEFIMGLDDQYETIVGERGVRLSGGQRQRIGIARALYHDPNVLIMDEATSALDGETEDAVMAAIRELAGQKTIILIAHRLTTIEECDCIYLLGHGKLLAQGSYQQLVENSRHFRDMARLSA